MADNNPDKQGGNIIINGCEKLIIPPEKLLEYEEKDIAILFTSDAYAYEIYTQLEEIQGEKEIDIFVLSLMIARHVDDTTRPILLSGSHDKENKISKIIHYFWLSKELKAGLVAECIESWKRTCSDYEFKEWNGDNYDVTANPFAYEAFKLKKWAYASDYARLDVVYKYGGIYLDLDVLLHKCLYRYRQTDSSMVKGITDTDLERQRFHLLYQSVLNTLSLYKSVYNISYQWKDYLLFLMTLRADSLYSGIEELDYLFPFPKVKRGSHVILYGMGTYG